MARAEKINPIGPSVEVLLGLPRHEGGNRTRSHDLKEIIEVMRQAQLAPRREVSRDTLSLGKHDRINPGLQEKEITDYLRKYVEKFAGALDVTVEKYLDSLPDLSEANAMKSPFIVDPRLSGEDLVNILGLKLEPTRDKVPLSDKLSNYGNIKNPYIKSGFLTKEPEKFDDRIATFTELVFANSQGVFDPYSCQIDARVSDYPHGEVVLNVQTDNYSRKYSEPNAEWFVLHK